MDHFFSNNYGSDDDIPNEKISLDDLYNRKREVEDNRIKVYQRILTRLHNKIKMTARQKHEEQYLFYVVPEFIFGIPTYNVNTCISYLVQKLEENGFVTRYTHPNLLFISWKHYIPHYKREEIKQMYGVKVDGFGNVMQGNDDKKKDHNDGNLDSLILKTGVNSKEKQLSLKKEKEKKDYKDISNYSPSGIYGKELFEKLKDKLS